MNVKAAETMENKESRPKITVMDFDGCLATNRFLEAGEPINKTISRLKQEQVNGAKVILRTNRQDKPLDGAVNLCKEQNTHLDAVNENLSEVIKAFGGGTRKIFANEYRDGRVAYMAEEEDSWAAREAAFVCQSEREASKGTDDWAYGVFRYESALRAYQTLARDGHSGFSIQVIKSILNRLADGKCLTPIEDTPDTWSDITGRCSWKEGYQKYQCKRMPLLFEEIAPGGTATYSDINRVCGINVNYPSAAFGDGMMTRLIDTIFPIIMSYPPSTKKYRVFSEDFLIDPKGGDYDTFAYLYTLTPDDKRIELNRYFKEEDGRMVPIEKAEYEGRKTRQVKKK